MATNDEIINKMKHSKLTIAQQLPIMLNEARADTAKRIFKALEAIKDEYGNPLLDFLYYKGESYAKLKKRFKVD